MGVTVPIRNLTILGAPLTPQLRVPRWDSALGTEGVVSHSVWPFSLPGPGAASLIHPQPPEEHGRQTPRPWDPLPGPSPTGVLPTRAPQR